MKREDVYRKMAECGIMPTTFVYDLEDTVRLAATLHANGIHVIELLQRTPHALEAVSRVKEALPDMVVGAGTVLNVEKAKETVAAGADYIVSPYYHQDIVDYANAQRVAVVPGCATISEISHGYDSGLRHFKYFPAKQLGGVEGIRQIGEIYADVRYVATGGVYMEDVFEFAACEKVLAVGTTCMMPKELIEARRWDDIARLCRKTVAAVQGFELAWAGTEDPRIRALLTLISDFSLGRSAVPPLPEQYTRDCGADLIFYVNDVVRALAWLSEQGFQGKAVRWKEEIPVIADCPLSSGGPTLRLIARHHIYRA